MRMKLRNIPKSLALLDTSIFTNCRPLSVENRYLLLKLNRFLYDFNFDVLDKYWKKKTSRIMNKKRLPTRSKMHKIAAELKDDPFWQQLHDVENFLHQEEQHLKYAGNSSKEIGHCVGCRNFVVIIKGKRVKNTVNEEGCHRDVEMGFCPSIMGKVFWSEELMS